MIIYITSGCEGSAVAQRFLKAYPRAERRIIADSEAARRDLYAAESGNEKKHIFITRAAGQHFKVCPGTSEPYLCCNYWILHQSANCPFNCSYCILQYYLNNPLLTVYSNTGDLKDMVRKRIREEPRRLFRIGTGELADSLALDHIAFAGPELIRFAAGQENMILELKTKSVHVDHLTDIPHRGKTVISWSLNPPSAIREHEEGSAPLPARMEAVKKVQDAGYMLGFHFDPMLAYENSEREYRELVRTLFEYADPSRIAWISVGSLRFPPEMAEKVRRKFPQTRLLDSEMIRGMDNKQRYFKPLRIGMYQNLYRALREYGGKDLFIYFCMEDAAVWKRVTGFAPDSNAHLDYLFAGHLVRKFPGLAFPKPELKAYRAFDTQRSWEKH